MSTHDPVFIISFFLFFFPFFFFFFFCCCCFWWGGGEKGRKPLSDIVESKWIAMVTDQQSDVDVLITWSRFVLKCQNFQSRPPFALADQNEQNDHIIKSRYATLFLVLFFFFFFFFSISQYSVFLLLCFCFVFCCRQETFAIEIVTRLRLIISEKKKKEPPRDKTNKMACAHSEDSDQPGHPPSLIRVFAVRMKKAWVLSYPLSAKRRLWSDWADAQADLSLRWAHSHFVGFVMKRLIFHNTLYLMHLEQTLEKLGFKKITPFKQYFYMHSTKLPTTPILNCGNLIITNYLIIIRCKPFQKFHFKLP